MKYKLKKYLPAGLAVIISGTMLFNCVEEMRNGSSKTEEQSSSKSYEDDITNNVLTSETALSNIKEKIKNIFNKEEETTTFTFEETEATTRDLEMKIKIVFDRLIKKYYKKIGTQEISMECTVPKSGIFKKSEITINANTSSARACSRRRSLGASFPAAVSARLSPRSCSSSLSLRVLQPIASAAANILRFKPVLDRMQHL